jgi:hypothetical protein
LKRIVLGEGCEEFEIQGDVTGLEFLPTRDFGGEGLLVHCLNGLVFAVDAFENKTIEFVRVFLVSCCI